MGGGALLSDVSDAREDITIKKGFVLGGENRRQVGRSFRPGTVLRGC